MPLKKLSEQELMEERILNLLRFEGLSTNLIVRRIHDAEDFHEKFPIANEEDIRNMLQTLRGRKRIELDLETKVWRKTKK